MIFRWGHFADLHFEFENYDTDVLRPSLIKILKNLSLDALLIAGDIFHKGQNGHRESEKVREYLHAMADACGCKYQNIFITAGNHDLERSETRAGVLDAIIKDYKKNPRNLQTKPNHRSNVIHHSVCAPFQNAVNLVRGGNDAPLIHGVYELEHANIIILNTAIFAGQTYPGQENPDRSLEDTALYIADHHLSKLCERMRKCGHSKGTKLNIVLAHHGYGCFVSSEFHKLTNALDDMGVDLYLCGHVHQNQHAIIPRTFYIPQISCGGLFADGYNSPSFLVGEFDTETKNVTITAYEFNENQSQWVPSAAFPRPWVGNALTFVPCRPAILNPYLSILKTIAGNHCFSYKDFRLCTYSFVRQIHECVLPHLKSVEVRNDFEHILRDCVRFEAGKAMGFYSKDAQRLAFVTYYSLALVYKNDGQISVNKPPSIGMLVDTYGALFPRETFPLSEEVRAWYYRYKGDAVAAYTCDTVLTNMLPLEINAGVHASFASSVCAIASQDKAQEALYGGDSSKLYQDWRKAYLNMSQVIQQWKETWGAPDEVYPKHHFISGKLLYFAAKFNWGELYRENILGNSVSREVIVFNALKCFSDVQAQDNSKATYKTSAFPEYQKWSTMCVDLLGQALNPSSSKERQDYVNV